MQPARTFFTAVAFATCLAVENEDYKKHSKVKNFVHLLQ